MRNSSSTTAHAMLYIKLREQNNASKLTWVPISTGRSSRCLMDFSKPTRACSYRRKEGDMRSSRCVLTGTEAIKENNKFGLIFRRSKKKNKNFRVDS